MHRSSNRLPTGLCLSLALIAIGGAGCLHSAGADSAAPVALTPATGLPPSARGADLRAGPNVIGVNCDGPECQTSCMAGSTILLAYGFHGRTYDSRGPVTSRCGEAVEWLGECIGQESCAVITTCKTSAMYVICR